MRRALQVTPKLVRSLKTSTRVSSTIPSSPPTPTTSGTSPVSLPLQVSTLPNGIRVATDLTPGHFVAAGVYVDAGSRYESRRTRGSSHFVDRLGFKSTSTRTSDQMIQEMEGLGGQFQASSSREGIMYQSTTYNHSLPSVLSILSDTVQNPLVLPEDIDQLRDAVGWEIGEIKKKPEAILPEILHEVAYKDNTLGNPLLCPEENLETMSPEVIKEFLGTWYKPERMVVAGAGVEHNVMLELTDRFFGGFKSMAFATNVSASSTLSPASLGNAVGSGKSATASGGGPQLFKQNISTSAGVSAAHSSIPVLGVGVDEESPEYLATARARYTGGELILDVGTQEFTHICIAFEALDIHDEDIYALAVLQMLLGGGGSFSAGGPGKGMYTRLYTSVLNQYHAVDHCTAFHHCYLDSGLFGITMVVNPDFLPQAPNLMASQFDSISRPILRGGVGEGDLSRAKNQLKSSLAMALESRMVQAEDLGRQVLMNGFKVPIEEINSKIDDVNLSGLFRVATRVLRPWESSLIGDRAKLGKPTILVQGPLKGLPDITKTLDRWGLIGPNCS